MATKKHRRRWQAVLIYAAALFLSSWAIVWFNLPDSLLLLFIVPCVLLAFFYERRVYLTMITLVVIASIWVTYRVSISFTTSLTTIAVATLSGLSMAEIVRALVLARVRAEEALRRAHDELELRVQERTAELQAQYAQGAAILRSVGDAILMTDAGWRIRYVNPAFIQLTGYTSDEVLDQNVCALGIMANATLCTAGTIGTPPLRASPQQRPCWQGEMRLQRRHGRSFDALLTVTPIHDAAEQMTGYVFSYRDISQSKDLERARNRFISNVSHQFRTPVTTLKLNVALMEREVTTEKQHSRLKSMAACIEWLIQLIEDTLEIVALDSGKGITAWEPVSLSAITQEVGRRYQDRARNAGLTLVVTPVPAALPGIEGDEERLYQAVSRLVDNAIAFTPAGGRVTVAVQPVAAPDGDWVMLTVRDTGPGIPPEELEKVFDRFFRGSLAESGHTAGTGLGLSIVQKIMELHGGRVTVESEIGAGSTFTLWLHKR